MIVLVVGENREYLCRLGEEIGSDLGILSVPEDAEIGDVIETHLGNKFTVMEPRVTDLFVIWRERGPQYFRGMWG